MNRNRALGALVVIGGVSLGVVLVVLSLFSLERDANHAPGRKGGNVKPPALTGVLAALPKCADAAASDLTPDNACVWDGRQQGTGLYIHTLASDGTRVSFRMDGPECRTNAEALFMDPKEVCV